MRPQDKVVCSFSLLLLALTEPTKSSEFHLPGDYLLGGLFTLHANVKGAIHLNYLQVPVCKEYEMKVVGYNLMQAMRFAVEEVNNHSSLLPGVLLGYEMVDICYVSNNIQPALYFLAREDNFLPIQDDYNSYAPRVVAVIGPDNSESTSAVAHLLSLFLLPQITYSAVSDELRNKQRFPSLLRTVLGAHHHMRVMVLLMLQYGWNWIVVLVSSDEYGRENGQLLSEQLMREGICIAFQETLPMPQPNRTLTAYERDRLVSIVEKLQRSSARIVVLLSPDLSLHNFFREVVRQNLTGIVWIASESWSIDPVLHNLAELRHTGTFLGITTEDVPIPRFSEFRTRSFQAGPPTLNKTSPPATCNQECDACLNITKSFDSILTLSGERVVFSVYAAVYAVAHALHSFLGCNETRCSRKMVHPWKLLQKIQKVNFSLLGHQIVFDKRGDMAMGLEVIQWRWEGTQKPFQSIAFYHPAQGQLLNISPISWNSPNNTVPLSMCSKSCQAGQRKKPVGLHPCCFECIDCTPGTFLNQSDEFECQPCPDYEWSHKSSTFCYKRLLVFLEWHEVPTIIVAVLATVGFFSTLAVLAIFWRYFQTPMVRSAGGPMCFLMLTPVLVAYLAVPVYVGRPTILSCLCRQSLFTLCFTICISCITARSFQIVCVFKMALRLPRAYSFWIRYHGPYVFVAFFTALKVALVAGNVLFTTAVPTLLADPDDPKVVILSCNPNYRQGLLLNTSLDVVLSVMGFSFAYMGKELPTNYNEAKFITLSMTFYFVSCVSLCTFMSVYQGVLVTIMELSVMVLNLLGISLGYFGPKCYMVLFYPERNTQAYFNSMIQGYTMRKN